MTDLNAKTEKYKTNYQHNKNQKKSLGQNIRVCFNKRDRYSSQNMKSRSQVC